jgi:hypothetical protein
MADDVEKAEKEFQSYLMILRHIRSLIWDGRARRGDGDALVAALLDT